MRRIEGIGGKMEDTNSPAEACFTNANSLVDVERLAKSTATVVGLGSGGSQVALHLARAGVGRILLVDRDRLTHTNIARHACFLQDVGRSKTDAVADLVVAAASTVTVETVEVDILTANTRELTRIATADVVIGATDSEASKLALNRVCWIQGTPAIYGAAFDGGFGGDIFCALPPNGPCYACFNAFTSNYFADDPPPIEQPNYGLHTIDTLSSSGLSIDIAIIAALLARRVLALLLKNAAGLTYDLPGNWLLFGNRAAWIFRHPLESIFVEVPQQANCVVCGEAQ